MSSPQVLIVGAGPCGLAAALVLCKNGIPVRLIEKALDYQVGDRGTAIQPRILELFRILGLVTDVFDNSIEPPQMRAYDGKTIMRTWDFVHKEAPTPAVPYPNARMLGQWSTEGILRSHLSRLGVTVELGTELVDFTQDAHKVTANLLKRDKGGSSENETLEVDWVIGADGARGVTRKHLGINFWGETLEKQAFLVADVDMEGVDRKYRAAYGNIATGLAVTLPLGRAPHFSLVSNGTPEEIQQVVDGGFDALKAYLSKVMKDESVVLTKCAWVSYFRPNIRCADKFNVGRVFIAGDGAHVHSPMGGQGLNSSVQDSVNLAWKLSLAVKNLSPPSLLSTYETERMPLIKEMLKLTTSLHTESMSDRNMASNDTSKSVNQSWVRENVFKQLGVNYQWSEIVLDQRLDAKENVGNKAYTPYGKDDEFIQAGDRAPDAPNLVPITAEGRTKPTTLFDLLTPFTHTALVFELPQSPPTDTEPPSPASTRDILDALGNTIRMDIASSIRTLVLAGLNQVLVDTQGHARRAYDVDASQARKALPSVVIIRPDTYIGAFVYDVQGVEKYFSKIFV
ncbi:hypothetical protein BS47DRAFT_1334240 [Hydnum rufescens UP504]|uniref:FAD-binding domain-containing protein n=1 Tax=Hydnum rufescens UP504 TaxID=1448309 RepID=A0A9P6DJU2_9AGAM|nr:hypothetical protein BS47DRAFT_1334240 [Hydnum rufescens UP504]